MDNAARIQPAVRYASSVSDAAAGADAVLHLTEWADYRVIDPVMLAAVVAQRNMIDARCALDETAWRSAGWSFRIPGRA
jgi:UDPglucose 6-dehydrogenase